MPQATLSHLDPASEAEAIAIVLGGLGKAELENVASYAAPLYWWVLDANGQRKIKGGSVFFLDTGQAKFAVTAGHVVQEFFDDSRTQRVTCIIGANGKHPIRIPLGDRLMAATISTSRRFV
jgi:hypothetical protein